MSRPAPRRTLYAQMLVWLAGYGLLLSVVVMGHGFLVNEYAESLVWDSLLNSELDHFVARRTEQPDYRWRDSPALQLYSDAERPPPVSLQALPEGIHDEWTLGDAEVVVLVRQGARDRYTLVLDITELEQRETGIILTVIGLATLLVVVLGTLLAWGLRRAVRPLQTLEADIRGLVPDRSGQRIQVDASASSELAVIANALNDYQHRTELFLERERVFIDTASHELRTPIAVISGASELALAQPGLPLPARHQVQRILHTARHVEQLVTLLLTLTKDPARLARSIGSVALHDLLPEIVADHLHLLQGKALSIRVLRLAPCTVQAPLHMVQAAIGNLLRNAIEHSNQGEILISLDADATLTIDDPGHGMTPEEVSRVYTQLARGGGEPRQGGGIGLHLLARLCEHLAWVLTLQSTPGRGTVAQLGLARHLERPAAASAASP